MPHREERKADNPEHASGRDSRPLMTITEARAQLGGIARSTYYRIEFFRTRTVYVGGAPRIDPADMDLYIAINKGPRRRRQAPPKRDRRG